MGRLDLVDAVCRRLVARSGWRIVSVDYWLAPERPYPTAVDDCFVALEWGQAALRRATGGRRRERRRNLAAACAPGAIAAGLAPALLLIPEYDPLRDEGLAYAARLQQAGVDARVVRFDDMTHGFFFMLGVFDRAGEAVDIVADAVQDGIHEEFAHAGPGGE